MTLTKPKQVSPQFLQQKHVGHVGPIASPWAEGFSRNQNGQKARAGPLLLLHPSVVRPVVALLCAVWAFSGWAGAAAGQVRVPGAAIPCDAAYRFLAGRMDDQTVSGARFLQSYASADCNFGAPANAAYVYDQALVLLAFLARQAPGDLQRASDIADALVLAQHKDRTFKDGRLRNAYACGSPIDPRQGWARLPGYFSPERRIYLEDEYALGSDTGNMAWAAIALVQAQLRLSPANTSPYFAAAVRMAEWIVANTTATDGPGGFYGGFAGPEKAVGDPNGQVRLTWRSTEHNIDLVALFAHLESALRLDAEKNRFWGAQKAHALKFVQAMGTATPGGAYFWSGTAAGTHAPNREVLPLDPQTWAVLALGTNAQGRYAQALDWALGHCRAGTVAHALDFNCQDGDGAWWEGTAQAAAALRFLKREDQAEPIIDALKNAQISAGAFAGGMPAASICGLTTGFHKTWLSTGETLPVLYPNAPHIGATAWFIFALLGKNPFFLLGPHP